nr:tetratricopeptide repeat protein [Saprospiraceae bacterium]
AIVYQKGIAEALKYQAVGYTVQKNFRKALYTNEASLSIARQLDDTLLISQTLNNIGINYERLGLPKEAISNYLESLDYAKNVGDDRMRCFTYRNVGFLYDKLGTEEKAVEYFNKGAEVARNSDHHMIKYIPYLTAGNNNIRKGQYQEAIESLKTAYPLCTNNYSRAVVLNELAGVYKAQKNWPLALDQLKQAIAIIEKSGNQDHLEEAQLSLASILFQKGDYSQCLNLLEQILAKKGKDNKYSFNDKTLYQLLAETQQQLQEHEKAARAYQQLAEIQDSLYDGNRLDLMFALEAKYKMNEKEQENAFLRAQQEQSEALLAQRKKSTLYAILLAALISILALLIYQAYRVKQRFNQNLRQQVKEQTQALQKTNDHLNASNIELERFAYIASHDLKEPLRNIASFSSLIERKLDDPAERTQIGEYLDFIKQNAYQMNQLIRDVLEYSRVESGRKDQPKETNLAELIGQVKQSILTDIKEKNVRINLPVEEVNFSVVPSQLFLVFKNLISNGIKYNNKEEKIIDVSYLDQGSHHQFCIGDNGIGIAPQYQEQVFEMFKRLHSRQEYQGTGLGLAICKKIITNLGGDIWYESTDAGSNFYFTIAK